MLPPPPKSTLFPYTTLFRSCGRDSDAKGPPPQPRLAQLCEVVVGEKQDPPLDQRAGDRKSTRLNSSHVEISYAVFCLKKKKSQTSNASSTLVQRQTTRSRLR